VHVGGWESGPTISCAITMQVAWVWCWRQASFREGFVLVAEARIIAGTGSGRSCSTNCGEFHPPTWACQSRTWVSGFLGGLWGAHPLGSVDGLQQTRVG